VGLLRPPKHELLGRLLKALKIPEGTDSAELFALTFTTSNLFKILTYLLPTGMGGMASCLPPPLRLLKAAHILHKNNQ